MGGPGVESVGRVECPPAPNTHPIRPRDPGTHKRQGLLLCAEHFPAANSCIWLRALPRCRRCRASRWRKPIRRGRCALRAR
jgi:hypothetical protein